MGLLEKLKSFFGAGEERPASRPDEPEVTVEHEPAAESEHLVKGTDAADEASATGGTETAGASRADTSGTNDASAGPSDGTTDGRATDEVESCEDADAMEETRRSDAAVATDTRAGTGTEPTDETDGAESTADSPPVEEIKGIGPTYSERLGDAGIGTVADLAAADPEAVAEAAETSRSRADGWIERARER
jgi:predicted flap endonuclease-1-like 5' DNA nuclease